MKKLIFTFFIIFSIPGLSNPIFDSLIGPRWNCSNLSDNQLIFLVISKDSENPESLTILHFLNPHIFFNKIKQSHLYLYRFKNYN